MGCWRYWRMPNPDAQSGCRDDAARGLIRLADARFVTPLFAVMRSDAGLQQPLRENLSLLRDPQALAPLLAESQATDRVSRLVTAQMLGRLHQLQAADRLALMMAGDADNEVRKAALLALGNLRDRRALQGLIPLLKSPLADERARVAALLGSYHDRMLTMALLPLLTDTEKSVRLAAIIALGNWLIRQRRMRCWLGWIKLSLTNGGS